jgi:energy-coupling factor transporter ATP-binding protein EcfA2
MASITSVDFRHFKGFSQYSLSLQRMNILVGPNNCGKSTLIGAFKILAAGIKKARAKRPEARIKIEGQRKLAYNIPESTLGVSTENVHTDYEDIDSWVSFRLSNKNRLKLLFPADGGCYLVCESERIDVESPSDFKREYPITVSSAPIIGPVEHEEDILKEETIKIDLGTHRASRHFRNFWYHYKEGFEDFAYLVKNTWPGMEIKPPARASGMSSKLVMWCLENRITRELFWSGYGFQVWCQLLTHISRSSGDSILLIDEPEVYLHPDVQRQLLSILRSLGPDIVIATHSTEIMAEADPSEILLIDKHKQSARRLRDVREVQKALEEIGSIQNITLTNLARNKKLLFVEGIDDFSIIRRFAGKLGFKTLALGNDITAVESGGFSTADKIEAFAWGFERTAETVPKIAAIFDRDYFCGEEIDARSKRLSKAINLCHFHCRKEIENYLLVIPVLQRALQATLAEKANRNQEEMPEIISVADLLAKLSEPMKVPATAQYVAKRVDFIVHTSINRATIGEETMKQFNEKWENIDTRMEIVPGNELLKSFRTSVQEKYGVTITDVRIIDNFKREEVASDMSLLCGKLEEWRTSR